MYLAQIRLHISGIDVRCEKNTSQKKRDKRETPRPRHLERGVKTNHRASCRMHSNVRFKQPGGLQTITLTDKAQNWFIRGAGFLSGRYGRSGTVGSEGNGQIE